MRWMAEISKRFPQKYYPTYIEIAESILTMMKVNKEKIQHIVKVEKAKREIPSDVPDPAFTGPF